MFVYLLSLLLPIGGGVGLWKMLSGMWKQSSLKIEMMLINRKERQVSVCIISQFTDTDQSHPFHSALRLCPASEAVICMILKVVDSKSRSRSSLDLEI